MQWSISTYINSADYTYKNIDVSEVKQVKEQLVPSKTEFIAKRRGVPDWFYSVKDLNMEQILEYTQSHDIRATKNSIYYYRSILRQSQRE